MLILALTKFLIIHLQLNGCLQIQAICQEAGMHAVRKNRYVILPKDFEKGYRTNVKKPDTDFEFYKWDLEARTSFIIQLVAHVGEVM